MKRLGLSLVAAFILGLFATMQMATGAYADGVASHGTFNGENGHKTSGKVSIVKTGGGYQIVLENNFSFDGAPDPYVALGGNSVKSSGIVAVLDKNTGRQVYNVPAGVDPTKFSKVYIWCKRFGVSLGSAPLSN